MKNKIQNEKQIRDKLVHEEDILIRPHSDKHPSEDEALMRKTNSNKSAEAVYEDQIDEIQYEILPTS
jgi:hypothetical protein